MGSKKIDGMKISGVRKFYRKFFIHSNGGHLYKLQQVGKKLGLITADP